MKTIKIAGYEVPDTQESRFMRAALNARAGKRWDKTAGPYGAWVPVVSVSCDSCGSTKKSTDLDAINLGIADPICCEA